MRNKDQSHAAPYYEGAFAAPPFSQSLQALTTLATKAASFEAR